MNPNSLLALLQDVQSGATSIEKAFAKLGTFPSEFIPDACLDHQRLIRTGIPEVIYGASKTAEQIATIAEAMLKQGGPVLATRVDPEKASKIISKLPQFRYAEDARMLICNPTPTDTTKYRGQTLIISAGTSDIPVAEEATLTLETLGHPVQKLYDAGVAGLHRLLGRQDILRQATVIIVVAGMEGALPSVVGGLVSCPVIAVPTSVGYGASFGGIAALLGMLNSCAPGVAVVNIDNGFGAACMAEAINRNFRP
ncbi:MAG: nickel pincer cofactor biosynthesis protein LarB [Proteobacteria bacterium]|nr:nickel pincer cofactor biosynthesis protein LarB [Pseudomonadota bacterium]